MASKSLDIVLKAHDGASAPMEKLVHVVESAHQQFEKLKTVVEVSLAAVGIGLGIREIFEAAAEGEEAVNGLAAALKLAGDSSQQSLDEAVEFAESIATVTTYSDDAVIAAERMAVTLGGFTGDALKSVTHAAAGLAARLNIDLDAAMKLIIRGSEGNTSALSRYGIVIDKNLSAQEKFAQLLRIGSDGFALAEAKTNTFRGAMTQLHNAWEMLMENVGMPLVRAATVGIHVVQGLVATVSGLFRSQASVFDSVMSHIGDAIVGTWQWIAANALPPVIGLGHATGAVLAAMWAMVSQSATAIAQAFVFVVSPIAPYVMPVLSRLGQAFIVMFASVEFAAQHWRDILQLVFLNAVIGVVSFAERVRYFFGTVIPELLAWFGRNWRDIFTTVWNFTKTVIENMGKNLGDFFVAVFHWLKGEGFDFKWTGLLDGFKSTLQELPQIAAQHNSEFLDALIGQAGDIQARLGDAYLDKLNERLKGNTEEAKKLGDAMNFKPPDLKTPELKLHDAPEKQKKEKDAGIKEDKGPQLEESRFLQGYGKAGQEEQLRLARTHLEATQDLVEQQKETNEHLKKIEDGMGDSEAVSIF